MNIYAWRYNTVSFIMIAALLSWFLLSKVFTKKQWKALNLIVTCVALYFIYKYTIAGREVSSMHQFVFAADFTNEYYREMLMNTFLYFPLGLSLTCLVGLWSILIGFFLSFFIEGWQYFAGTGLCQGTDVICNTLGVVIGTLSCIKKCVKE